jgi:uncharacterized damage-inducible protein DinB
MFTREGIRKLHSWTHSCLNVVFDHLATIPASDYGREVPGFGAPTLGQQVLHVLNCEGFWIHMLQGLPYTDRSPADCPAISDARLLQREVAGQTIAYLSGLSDQRLNTDTELRFPDGEVAIRTPALIVHHLLTHAFHHKGQMVTMCRALGHPVGDTDLNQFQ